MTPESITPPAASIHYAGMSASRSARTELMMVLTIAGRNFSLKGGRIDTSVIARAAKAAVHTG